MIIAWCRLYNELIFKIKYFNCIAQLEIVIFDRLYFLLELLFVLQLQSIPTLYILIFIASQDRNELFN